MREFVQKAAEAAIDESLPLPVRSESCVALGLWLEWHGRRQAESSALYMSLVPSEWLEAPPLAVEEGALAELICASIERSPSPLSSLLYIVLRMSPLTETRALRRLLSVPADRWEDDGHFKMILLMEEVALGEEGIALREECMKWLASVRPITSPDNAAHCDALLEELKSL